jgi:hypothetical protein
MDFLSKDLENRLSELVRRSGDGYLNIRNFANKMVFEINSNMEYGNKSIESAIQFVSEINGVRPDLLTLIYNEYRDSLEIDKSYDIDMDI